MDAGIVTAKIDEIGYITHAENLGYTHCWVTDIPIYVAGYGPRAQALAGEIGDGLISGMPRGLERQSLRQIMLYPPLNRQYRVIEDFAVKVMARL